MCDEITTADGKVLFKIDEDRALHPETVVGRQLRMLAGRLVVYGWSVLAGTITRLSPAVSFITVIGLMQLNLFTSVIPAKAGIQ